MEKQLTDKQERFCQEYVIDLNATQAAIRAGYAPKWAHTHATRMATNGDIVKRVAELQQPVFDRYEVTTDRVIRELACKAFTHASEIFTWGPMGINVRPIEELSEEQCAAVAEVGQSVTKDGGSIRVKMADSIRALELLGRRLRIWDGGAAETAAAAAGGAAGALAAALQLTDAQLKALHDAS